MTSRLKPSGILLLCLGAGFFVFGVVLMLLPHRTVSVLRYANEISLCFAGVGYFFMAFSTKRASLITVAACTLAAAGYLLSRTWTRGLSDTAVGVVFPAASLSVALMALHNLYRGGWLPVVRVVSMATPTRWKSLYHLANCYYQLARMDEASRVVDLARKRNLQPEWFDYLEGAILFYRGDYPRALPLLRKTIDSPRPIPKAHYFRGLSLFELKRFEEAVADLSRWIMDNPNEEKALFCRAIANKELGNPGASMADYDRILSNNAENSAALYNRGACHYDLGNIGAATADWTAAIHLKVPNPSAFVALGGIAYDASRIEDAIELFRQGYILDPSLKAWIPPEILEKIQADEPER